MRISVSRHRIASQQEWKSTTRFSASSWSVGELEIGQQAFPQTLTSRHSSTGELARSPSSTDATGLCASAHEFIRTRIIQIRKRHPVTMHKRTVLVGRLGRLA